VNVLGLLQNTKHAHDDEDPGNRCHGAHKGDMLAITSLLSFYLFDKNDSRLQE
jgi:hypothetical protein